MTPPLPLPPPKEKAPIRIQVCRVCGFVCSREAWEAAHSEPRCPRCQHRAWSTEDL